MKTPFKKVRTLFLAAMMATTISNAQNGIVVCDLTTGMFNASTPVPYGFADDTWTVAKLGIGGFGPAWVSSFGSWDVNGCGRWITPVVNGTQPSPNTGGGGFYIYKANFNMVYTCFPWAKITLPYVGADNNLLSVAVNGHSYPLAPGTANDYNPLTQNVTVNIATTDLVPGTNVIAFLVNNGDTYTGFYACGNLSIGYCSLLSGSQDLQNNTDASGLNGTIKASGQLSFGIHPNPSNGKFSLTFEKGVEGRAVIFDMLGRPVWQSDISAETLTYNVDLSNAPEGIFSISVFAGTITEKGRIILQ